MSVKKNVFLHKRRLRIAKHYRNLRGLESLVWHPKWDSAQESHPQAHAPAFPEHDWGLCWVRQECPSSFLRHRDSLHHSRGCIFRNPAAVHNKKPQPQKPTALGHWAPSFLSPWPWCWWLGSVLPGESSLRRQALPPGWPWGKKRHFNAWGSVANLHGRGIILDACEK